MHLQPFSVEKATVQVLCSNNNNNQELSPFCCKSNMKFKVFLLSFAVLVAATSAVTVCKCEDKKDTVSKYNVKFKDGDKVIEEKVEIDTEKQTETLTIPKTDTGKNGNEGEVKVVFDFKKNMTMHRLSAAKKCFLSESTEDTPTPDQLLKIIQQESPSATVMNATELKYDVVSTVTDRSILNDEMASMCAKLPIYLIKMTITQRVKRRYCHYHCYYRWYWCGYRRRCRIHIWVWRCH